MSGVVSYIGITLYFEKNRVDNGGKSKWWSFIKKNFDEWLVTIAGGFLFYKIGDGMITAGCMILDRIRVVDNSFCIDIYVYLKEFLFLIGGALFGTVFAQVLKALKNVTDKIIKRWQRKNS
jgi:hypothetical protein